MSASVEPAEAPRVDPDTARDHRWAWWVAAGAMALTLIPYLFGLSLTGASRAFGWYSWLGYNLDDSCVYLSWMRQAADGHLFQRNLFTTEAQPTHLFNVFFFALGWLSGIVHLPLIYAYHLVRLVLGAAFLRSVWWLIELLVVDRRARRAAMLLVCFSAGLGWVPGLWRRDGIHSPSDVWQPEAITFLCLYLSPLFLVSLLLMVGVIGWLVVGDRTGSWRPALYAGLCGLLLGNIHTYDVITLIAVWGSYLLVRTVAERRFDGAAWGRALMAGALTALSTSQVYYVLKTNPVFAQRAAVPTLSPSFAVYFLAYAPLIALATAGLVQHVRGKRAGNETGPALPGLLLLVVWAIANLAVAYLPVPYQRKMLMGEHLPLAILAGVGVTCLLRRVPGRAWTPALAGLVLVTSLTNWRFVLRDMGNYQDDLSQTRIHRPYMYVGEVGALQWLRDHAPADAVVQPLPWVYADPETRRVGLRDSTVACFAPGLTGHAVNAGHWGETPSYGETIGRWVHFQMPGTSDAERIELLRSSQVRYVVFTQKHPEDLGAADALLVPFRTAPPPYLRPVPEASNEDADVYEVRL